VRRHRLGAVLIGILVVCATVVISAAPASAHGLGGLKPTDYQTRLGPIRPSVPGITLVAVDLGTRLELTNTTAHDVIVEGYDGEPYLRVGPRGVFENTRSPATYFNRSVNPSGPAPKQADAKAPPVWKQTSDGTTARWHDHRAHYMGTVDPPVVQRDRSHPHVIDTFRIGMHTDGQALSATGHIVWVPPPSPWPWVIAALVIAAIVFALSRTRVYRTVFAVVLVVLTAVELAHVIGLWGASSASGVTKLVQSAYSIGGILLGVLALVWMRRRGTEAAIPLVLVATIFLFVAGGLADLTSLGASQLPTTFPNWLARLLVTTMLGLGAGLAAAAAFRLRPQPPPTRPVRRTAPARVTS